MTTTVTGTPGRFRYAFSLVRLAGRIVFRPSTPLPGTRLNIPVPPGPRGKRVEALRDIAERLGVPEGNRDGALTAELPLGCLLLEAHLPADDLTFLFPVAGMPDFDAMLAAAGHWADGETHWSAA